MTGKFRKLCTHLVLETRLLLENGKHVYTKVAKNENIIEGRHTRLLKNMRIS